MGRLNRRQFLGGSLAAGAVLALPSSRILGANNDIRLGVIGVGSHVKIGGMGRNEIAAHLKLPGLRFTALCDCDKANLMPEVEKLHAHNPSLKAYTDLRELLDDKNVDAVIVTTPNHWHALATIWACQAGKDVYVQKPTPTRSWKAARWSRRPPSTSGSSRPPHGPRDRTASPRRLSTSARATSARSSTPTASTTSRGRASAKSPARNRSPTRSITTSGAAPPTSCP